MERLCTGSVSSGSDRDHIPVSSRSGRRERRGQRCAAGCANDFPLHLKEATLQIEDLVEDGLIGVRTDGLLNVDELLQQDGNVHRRGVLL
jgi:hypothetical protein